MIFLLNFREHLKAKGFVFSAEPACINWEFFVI